MRAMPRKIDRERIPAELDLAEDLVANGEIEEASRIVDQVLFAAPKEGREVLRAYFLRGEILLERGEPRLALLAFDTAEKVKKDDSNALAGKGEALFYLWEWKQARAVLEKALRANKRNARAHRYMALALDRLGRRKLAELHFERAGQLDPEAWPMPVRVERKAFDALARAAIDSLPPFVKERLGPIGFLVEDYPELGMLADRPDDADPETLGLFFGEEIPARYESRDVKFVPNHIHLFQRNLEQLAADEEELEDEIRTTVYHEVGHYLGLDEDDLDRLGLG
jgi:predicted Zn-dependent protease with MMP-like domain/Flp pilus assembly protein TadD